VILKGDNSTSQNEAQYDVVRKRYFIHFIPFGMGIIPQKCHPERREGSPSTIHQNTQSQTKPFCSVLLWTSCETKRGSLKLHFVPFGMTQWENVIPSDREGSHSLNPKNIQSQTKHQPLFYSILISQIVIPNLIGDPVWINVSGFLGQVGNDNYMLFLVK